MRISAQSDREKSEGLPVAPFMDRDKVTKPTAQIGFIKFVLIPMFETVMKVCMIGVCSTEIRRSSGILYLAANMHGIIKYLTFCLRKKEIPSFI